MKLPTLIGKTAVLFEGFYYDLLMSIIYVALGSTAKALMCVELDYTRYGTLLTTQEVPAILVAMIWWSSVLGCSI